MNRNDDWLPLLIAGAILGALALIVGVIIAVAVT